MRNSLKFCIPLALPRTVRKYEKQKINIIKNLCGDFVCRNKSAFNARKSALVKPKRKSQSIFRNLFDTNYRKTVFKKQIYVTNQTNANYLGCYANCFIEN